MGGWNFYETAILQNISFLTWTVVEPSLDKIFPSEDKRINLVQGDGCSLAMPDNHYDTFVSIQVLEHVFEPNRMFSEMVRVLKPGGKGIIMVPQTSNLHMAPNHHYNFTRYWCEEAARREGVQILELQAMGGFWSSIASRLFLFFFQSFNCRGMTHSDSSRSIIFYLFLPLMILFACLALPICLLFSLGDLVEEPNNHLLVVLKSVTNHSL